MCKRGGKRNETKGAETQRTAVAHDGEGGGGGAGGEREGEGGRGGKRNAEADRRKISRGTHGRSVLVAGGWRIGRVAMEKRAGGIPRVRRLGPPQRETPIREIRGVATPNLPRCRRFSSAWLIDSATNQRPRRSSTSSSPPLCAPLTAIALVRVSPLSLSSRFFVHSHRRYQHQRQHQH